MFLQNYIFFNIANNILAIDRDSKTVKNLTSFCSFRQSYIKESLHFFIFSFELARLIYNFVLNICRYYIISLKFNAENAKPKWFLLFKYKNIRNSAW